MNDASFAGRVRLRLIVDTVAGFVGHPAYDTSQLRSNLDPFAFLLGGNDGGSLFGHARQ
jgi:hypothetical protein